MLITILPAGSQDSQSGSTTTNSDALRSENFGFKLGNIGFQVITTGFNAADATVALEHSNDGTNWSTVADSTLTLASGSANQCMILTNQAFAWYRVAFVKGSNSAGTFQVILNFN